MHRTFHTLIIGGGLAGLYAGYRLSQQGIDNYAILEADHILGGRVKGLGEDGFDLGATWFWGDFQPDLANLIAELELPIFTQYDQGDALYERPNSPPQRFAGFAQASPSLRIDGGMVRLIEALRNKQKSDAIFTDCAVKSVILQPQAVEIQANFADEVRSFFAEKILLALPPRLASQLDFQPALPPDLQQSWANTATWMAPHAKYIAVFKRPFWREIGLSGDASSQVGPMVEMHDISMAKGEKGCLFGFLGVPASVRAKAGNEAVRQHCRQQFARLFGEQALSELEYDYLQDWAASPLTATAADQNTTHQHPSAPKNHVSGSWANKVYGIGSEWSPNFSGYLAGAVEAVDRALSQMDKQYE